MKNSFLMNKVFKRKFRLMSENSELEGVLSGLSYSLEKPVWIVRLIFILMLVAAFNLSPTVFCSLVILYFMVGQLAPEWEKEPVDYRTICE